MKIVSNVLLGRLQLSVKPAVLLFLNEQGDDVAVVKAEECGIVARRVRKDGLDTVLPALTEARRLGC